MKEILGDAKNVRALLSNAKYAVDYYQREYRWEKKHVGELIDDLVSKFQENYEAGHAREQVEDYDHYFLGSIIVSNKDGKKFIIDGQQRLTTMTLMLIFFYQLLDDSEQRGQVAELIFSQKFGKKSFNIDVPERSACMEALYNGESFEESDESESVDNIIARYNDIDDTFPEELEGDALPYFVDWLMENVHFVEITAFSDEDAYTIFETMNDRGLSLTPTDMLKGYLLASITQPAARTNASQTWTARVNALRGLGKEEDADAIKSWLRSQYAQSIRERKRGAKPQDFDLIATEFHRWVRENTEALGLETSDDFARFIQRDFVYYSKKYQQLREAANSPIDGMEGVYFNAQHNITLQYPVLLAPLVLEDAEADKKTRIAAAYIDILVARRIWNFRAIDYSSVQYTMFSVMREIRRTEPAELVEILMQRLDSEEEVFGTDEQFRLHGRNGRQIRRLLARMTDYVEVQSGAQSRFVEYSSRAGKKGYEVEHIWANHPERHADEFAHPADFGEFRNRFGGLLLLPKSFNASYGDLTYEEKRSHYNSQNLLARSLCEECYEHNPGFLKFVKDSGLPFRAHDTFTREDLNERHELYRLLAEHIWNPSRLEKELDN